MKHRLPIGIQDFTSLREENFLYVDKTPLINTLLTGAGKYFFLSRPRRFGKSLLCSTLEAIFKGKKELFEGLAISASDWNWKKRPVVHLDLNPGNYTLGVPALQATIKDTLTNTASSEGLILRGDMISSQFGNLIYDLHQKTGERVAVIIDEYDKPLLGSLDFDAKHQEIKAELKGFYGVLKSSDAHIQFAFLTGVTKFSQVSVFSDLNNLVDLSFNTDFAALCGITQEELERYFSDEIDEIVGVRKYNKDDYLTQIKQFYNGYRFSEKKITVYNPFGLLKHFNSKGKFDTYWFATGTPTFLLNLIKKQKIDILALENTQVSPLDFVKFDTDNMEAIPVLYQTGYLTIADYDEKNNRYLLGYPNDEVRSAFSVSLLESYCEMSEKSVRGLVTSLPAYFNNGDIESIRKTLIAFFAEIPYDIKIPQEKYYESMIHLVFRMLGLYCRSEVCTNNGRIDSVVETDERVYCFEYKLNGSADAALAQIDTKGYLLPWSAGKKKLIKIGVSFSTEKRNITEWKTVID